jgi:hypothetical protein
MKQLFSYGAVLLCSVVLVSGCSTGDLDVAEPHTSNVPAATTEVEVATVNAVQIDADTDSVEIHSDNDENNTEPEVSTPTDIGSSFESTHCDSEFVAHARGLLGPAVADTPVLVYPDEYFDTLAETYGWSFSPLGIYMRGEVRIHERECRLAGADLPEDDRDAWREDRAEAMIVHELTHALDDALGRPSVHIEFVETDIMHAQAMAQPGTELWAFCLQQMAGYEVRDRCPAENRSAVIDAMTGFDGFPAELLDTL